MVMTNIAIDVPRYSHWLVDEENRGVWRFTPEKQQVSMMIDGIPDWLFNIAMEHPLSMEVSSWENHL